MKYFTGILRNRVGYHLIESLRDVGLRNPGGGGGEEGGVTCQIVDVFLVNQSFHGVQKPQIIPCPRLNNVLFAFVYIEVSIK